MLKRPSLGTAVILWIIVSTMFHCTSQEREKRSPENKHGNENTTGYSKYEKTGTDLTVKEIPQDYAASQGEMLFVQGVKKLALPLLHTDVNGVIEGFLARVNVAQTFVNTSDSAIEALYTFPLPENAAVDSMVMIIGKKRIKGTIKERGEAREIYERARRNGKTASLLEQERPNIFTQSIANIMKSDTIIVTISYMQELKYRDGKYNFHFPMVVGPRYIPGKSNTGSSDSLSAKVFRGTEKPTDQVPDADRITPPILPPSLRSGHDISLQVKINSGISPKNLSSPSHKISVTNEDDGSSTVQIMPNDNIPNKDFILEFTVADNSVRDVFLTHRAEDNDGFFQLIMIPKLNVTEKEVFPRELVFVVDNSGSMMGYPVEKCKEIMTLCLNNMRSDDVFRLIKFSGSTEIMSPVPLKATSENEEQALEYVDKMHGGGGTEMMKAIDAIFDSPEVNGRKRIVLFLTDGYVGNDREIIARIRQRLGNGRVFSLGVGSSVNRYLMEGIAYAGRGSCMIIRQDGDAKKVMEEFYSLIDAPVLTGISLEWKGVEISDLQPSMIPDLFNGSPLVVTGKFKNSGSGTLVIKGKLAGNRSYEKEIEIRLPQKETGNGMLPALWARRKIGEMDLMGRGIFDSVYSSDSVKKSILTLGLKYRIMTQYTSFVAVDDAVRNRDGKWVSVEQALPLPEGVSPNSQPDYRYMPQSRGSQCMAPMLNRKGGAGIGYGAGYGSGFGGSGSINGGSKGSMGGGIDFLKGASLTGGRSKASVMKAIMANMASLRYRFNKLLRTKPGAKGKITVKFAIDEFGKVIFCQILESTLNEPDFEKELVSMIKRWGFDKIDKPGDVTEVVYPFIFAQ